MIVAVLFQCVRHEFIGKPVELLKMSVASIAYALQNNLDFVALSNLDAAVYQVTIQLKVVTTAVFMMVILDRKFSCRRWLAIILLFCGVAIVQVTIIWRVGLKVTEVLCVRFIALAYSLGNDFRQAYCTTVFSDSSFQVALLVIRVLIDSSDKLIKKLL